MKKLISFLVVFLFSFSPSCYCQVSKEEILKKITEKYASIKNLSGEIEINMSVMGNIMKIPAKFWKSGKKFRMEMKMEQPGMPQPMEQIMIFDGTKMWQYQKTINVVTVIDFSKMPDKIKKEFEKCQSFTGMDERMYKIISQTAEDISLTEKERNGKKFYVLEIKNLTDISKQLPFQSQQKMQFFKKILIWVNPDYYIKKIEMYGEAKEPGMWIEFKNLREEEINPSLFKFKVPEGAKVMDMTEMMIEMMKKMEEMSEGLEKEGK